MRIVLYEFVTGGGWFWHPAGPPPASLWAEGSAMLRALAADLSALPGVAVDVLRDARFPALELPRCTVHQVHRDDHELETLERLSRKADWTLLIAPEFCGYLHTRCELVEKAGGRLLGPDSRFVALASDKQATAEHLARQGVRVPNGITLAPGAPLPVEFAYPAVIKPRCGAGSQGVERIVDPAGRANGDSPSRLEAFCPGTPASVALLCGRRQLVPLEPCLQRLGGDHEFAYQGGSLPMAKPLAQRARCLAIEAIRSFSDPLGYVGIDLVLGNDPTGTQDVVVEVNPRLTTSYVGLRALIAGNLAGHLLAVAEGHEVELCWKTENMAFDASGRVWNGSG